MSVQQFNPENIHITLTPSAQRHFAQQLKNSANQMIRLSTTTTGCSGLAYVTKLVEIPEDSDIKAHSNSEFTIYIEAKSLAFLNNLTLDFAKGDLGQAKLIYMNPNETGKCGCGESFSVTSSVEPEDNTQ